MSKVSQTDVVGTILLIGTSRGLGLAMADEFAKRRWHVVATVRGTARTKLHELAYEHEGNIEIETLDITHRSLHCTTACRVGPSTSCL